MISTEAHDHIDTVRKAYEGKDEYMIKYLVPEMSDAIIDEFTFEKAELSFKTRVVKITRSSVIINLNWKGSWWMRGGQKIENSGAADFVINRETMILSRIGGDNPFITPTLRYRDQ